MAHTGASGILVAAALALLATGGVAVPAGAQTSCPPAAGLDWLQVPLPVTTRAIRKQQPLTIVAIGSSSTQGAGASDPTRSYPARLAEALRRRLPALPVTVVNKGIGGETAADMLARFPTDVLPYRPQLVIWQVGSNAALKGVDPAAFERTVRDGVRQLKIAGADIVLMDPQFAPMLVKRPLHRRIVDVIREVARETKVAVFRRYDTMRHWIEAKAVPASDVVAADQLHMTDLSYACIARLLADSLVAAARLPAVLQSAAPSPIDRAAPD